MISRLGVHKGFVLVFWGGACALLLRWTFPTGDAPTGYRGVGLGVSGSGVYLVALFLSHWGQAARTWYKWLCLDFLSPERGAQAHNSSGSPQGWANNHPSCVPSFHQIPAFTLSLSKMFDCQVGQHSYILSQAWLVSETQTSETLMHGPMLIFWRWALLHCSCCQLVPENGPMTAQGFRV